MMGPPRRGRPPKNQRPVRPPAAPVCSGYYTELIRLHNWPPRFAPAAPGDGMSERNQANALACRAKGAAFGGVPLGLPGGEQCRKAWEGHDARRAVGGGAPAADAGAP